MAADLDGQMAPVRVEDVKRVVVHIRHRLLSFDVVFRADIPHRRLRPTDQNQKQALGDRRLGEIFFGKVMLALPCRTVDHGNAACLGITANATAEPAGQPHKGGSFRASRPIRSAPATTPGTRPDYGPCGSTRLERCDRRNRSYRPANPDIECSARPSWRAGYKPLPQLQTAPQGPLFRSPVCEKA